MTSNGTIKVDKHIYYVGQQFAKQQVLIHVDAQQQFHITSDGEHLKSLDILGLHYQQMDFQSYLITMKAEARAIERHRMAMEVA